MTLDEFFTGREASRRIFDVFGAAIAALGSAEMRVTKSQVAFRRGKAFAWAWVPGMYLHGRRRAAGPDAVLPGAQRLAALEADC